MEKNTSGRCFKLYIFDHASSFIPMKYGFPPLESSIYGKYLRMKFQFFCGNGSWGYSDELFFSPNPLHCDSIKGYIPTDRPHRRRVKYGLDYFWDHFLDKKMVQKIVQAYFTLCPEFVFSFVSTRRTIISRWMSSQLIERGEQGDTFSLHFDVGVSFHWTVEVPF